jgi:hypothetical protein
MMPPFRAHLAVRYAGILLARLAFLAVIRGGLSVGYAIDIGY